jgi:hypothetical protein
MRLVRGTGIRDIAEMERISIKKISSVLTGSRHLIQPKQHIMDGRVNFLRSIILPAFLIDKCTQKINNISKKELIGKRFFNYICSEIWKSSVVVLMFVSIR